MIDKEFDWIPDMQSDEHFRAWLARWYPNVTDEDLDDAINYITVLGVQGVICTIAEIHKSRP